MSDRDSLPHTFIADIDERPFRLSDALKNWLRGLRRSRNGEATVRETLEEIIEERGEADAPINEDERLLLANILELRDRTIRDVMVPRADIVAVEFSTSLKDAIARVTKEGHSRLPVYREALDDAVGFIHAKDMLSWRGADEQFSPEKIIRKVLFVAPSMQVLELLLEMRVKRAHMALVVDEFGGVDGLVTIEDLVEEIVGEIEDEHDQNDDPRLESNGKGTFVADARLEIESLEDTIGVFIEDEEREDIDTLGGLVFSVAGRVPIRGELVRHSSGVEFEVLEADPRRIKRLRIRTTNFKPVAV
ncbi:MAG: magnesium/cobalt efflux protein [Rhodospirillaceae bacterium TMED8]|nr:magnesium/cobalt efflux protein [Magnetovibrio sp.]OUT50435.1 MAG: magnesium/cobalt efflux protein [Rhodospirillaceae bacterium TMED8]